MIKKNISINTPGQTRQYLDAPKLRNTLVLVLTLLKYKILIIR
jgi:hypothetical protein